MTAREPPFVRRRAELQLQCAQQRAAFAQSVEDMQASVQGLNRGLGIVRGTRLMPMLLAALSAAGVLTRAGGVVRLLEKLWVIWQLVQRLRRSKR
ncbi:MAG TPA: YqjK family protein [Steroidobacteraceae bacterium]|jgi:hypothetical protein|nr:YqjK family protein [Steroidobacteraceae bacterium]